MSCVLKSEIFQNSLDENEYGFFDIIKNFPVSGGNLFVKILYSKNEN